MPCSIPCVRGFFGRWHSASLLAMLPVAAALAYQLSAWRVEALSSGKEMIGHQTEALLTDVQGIFEAAEETLRFLANSPAVQRRDWATCEQLVSQLSGSSARTAFIGVVSADGNLLCSSIPTTEPVSVDDRLFFRAVREKLSFSIGEYATGRSSGRASIHVAYPLMHESEFAGAVNMALDVQWLADRIAQGATDPDTIIYVLDGAARVLARTRAIGPEVGDNIPGLIPADGVTTSQAAVVETSILDGIERLIQIRPIVEAPGGTVWAVVAIEKAALSAPANQASLVSVLIFLLAISTALLTQWYFLSRLVVRPVVALSEAARNVRNGDATASFVLPTVERNEVAELISEFKEMAIAVASREKDRAELKRKDAQLREVSHRVKNHLAGIASMVRLEARRHGSSDRDVLKSMQHRIMAVADLYDLLAQQPDSGHISLAEYMKLVCGQLAAVISQDGIKIRTELKGDASLAPDRAMALGLLVNEVLTNAAKHAFPGGVGQIDVDMDATGPEIVVTISDDGIGFSRNEGSGLGATIIRTSAVQLGASLTVRSDHGTSYLLSFRSDVCPRLN